MLGAQGVRLAVRGVTQQGNFSTASGFPGTGTDLAHCVELVCPVMYSMENVPHVHYITGFEAKRCFE